MWASPMSQAGAMTNTRSSRQRPPKVNREWCDCRSSRRQCAEPRRIRHRYATPNSLERTTRTAGHIGSSHIITHPLRLSCATMRVDAAERRSLSLRPRFLRFARRTGAVAPRFGNRRNENKPYRDVAHGNSVKACAACVGRHFVQHPYILSGRPQRWAICGVPQWERAIPGSHLGATRAARDPTQHFAGLR